MTEIACGSKEFNPPFPFPPGASRGGVGSPHAGSTLRASKKRCHASLLPAPPTRGLPPPCGSPASALQQSLNLSGTTAYFQERSQPQRSADPGVSSLQEVDDTTVQDPPTDASRWSVVANSVGTAKTNSA